LSHESSKRPPNINCCGLAVLSLFSEASHRLKYNTAIVAWVAFTGSYGVKSFGKTLHNLLFCNTIVQYYTKSFVKI